MIDASGNISVSGAFKMGATTVIDASRNASFASVAATKFVGSLEGTDSSANYENALLKSGPGRVDTAAGATWIFADSLGTETNKYGIRHNQLDNVIEFWGDNQVKFGFNLQTGVATLPQMSFNDNIQIAGSKGIVWQSDAFGGSGDTASIILTRSGTTGEATRMRFTMTNDSDDCFEFNAPSNAGLLMNGNVVVHAGNVSTYAAAPSEMAAKKNIVRIENGLEKVKTLNGYTFEYLESDVREAGVMLEEVIKVLPEVVVTDDSGKKRVKYGNMVGLLIEAVKDLSAKVESLEARLS